MEQINNCENCAFYKGTPGSFLSDGFCYARKSKPEPVRKWFKACKFWVEKGDDDDSEE